MTATTVPGPSEGHDVVAVLALLLLEASLAGISAVQVIGPGLVAEPKVLGRSTVAEVSGSEFSRGPLPLVLVSCETAVWQPEDGEYPLEIPLPSHGAAFAVVEGRGIIMVVSVRE
jgi:hypothetical protein